MPAAPLRLPSLLLGIALGGFFDGILLHQVLQWHHLLSNVEAARDLRIQILADGLFHALMYVLAMIAGVLLWRRRAHLDEPSASRGFWGWLLAGFGLWHVLDTVLSHWLTGIHRVRVDSPHPLFWDLLWLGVFGLVPLAIGTWASRGGPGVGPRGAAAAVAAVFCAAAWAALPTGPSDQVIVVFGPQVRPGQAFDALARADARVLWTDASGGVWAVQLPAAPNRLVAEGAWLVTRSPVALGCVSFSRAGSGTNARRT